MGALQGSAPAGSLRHQGKAHRLDLKAALLQCWGSASSRCCTLSIPCPELALLGWCKGGAETETCLALPFLSHLGRCSSPRQGAGLFSHVPPCPQSGTEWALGGRRVWICSLAGLWVLLVLPGAVAGTETQCLQCPCASRGRGGGR